MIDLVNILVLRDTVTLIKIINKNFISVAPLYHY
jgi:hypothetical protein